MPEVLGQDSVILIQEVWTAGKKAEGQTGRQLRRDFESGMAGQRMALPRRCDFGSGCRKASAGQVWILEHVLEGTSLSSRPVGWDTVLTCQSGRRDRPSQCPQWNQLLALHSDNNSKIPWTRGKALRSSHPLPQQGARAYTRHYHLDKAGKDLLHRAMACEYCWLTEHPPCTRALPLGHISLTLNEIAWLYPMFKNKCVSNCLGKRMLTSYIMGHTC